VVNKALRRDLMKPAERCGDPSQGSGGRHAVLDSVVSRCALKPLANRLRSFQDHKNWESARLVAPHAIAAAHPVAQPVSFPPTQFSKRRQNRVVFRHIRRRQSARRACKIPNRITPSRVDMVPRRVNRTIECRGVFSAAAGDGTSLRSNRAGLGN